jgi:hypothetical protein
VLQDRVDRDLVAVNDVDAVGEPASFSSSAA